MTFDFGFSGNETLYFIIIFACYFLALEAIILGYASRASARSSVRARLATGGARTGASGGPAGQTLTQLQRQPNSGTAGLDQLMAQAGMASSPQIIALVAVAGGIIAFGVQLAIGFSILAALPAAILAFVLAPLVTLRILRQRRLRRFEAQLPEALDTLVRSLRAGHPVSSAVRSVRNMPNPIGDAFATVSEEVEYGLDLETAMRNLNDRVGLQDLGLLSMAIGVQTKAGGNLAELLENLSRVIRERLRMRLKARALSAEARFSALALSILPVLVFTVLQVIAPSFYGDVWDKAFVPIVLGAAVVWMIIGNVIMFRMVRFEI
ncbi:MAG: type II secretion system F family protein [Pseudomonadota bacterium]